jgi:hypothetical protein
MVATINADFLTRFSFVCRGLISIEAAISWMHSFQQTITFDANRDSSAVPPVFVDLIRSLRGITACDIVCLHLNSMKGRSACMAERFYRPVGFPAVFAASPMIVTLLQRATPSTGTPGAGENR